MKRTLICLAALACSAVAADAADLPVKAVRSVAVSPFAWTGFYAGVQGGYAWSQDGNVNSSWAGLRPASRMGSARTAASAVSMWATTINWTGSLLALRPM